MDQTFTTRPVLNTNGSVLLETLGKHDSDIILSDIEKLLQECEQKEKWFFHGIPSVLHSIESKTCQGVVLAKRCSFAPVFTVLEHIAILCELHDVPYVLLPSFQKLPLDDSIMTVSLKKTTNTNSSATALQHNIQRFYVKVTLPFLLPQQTSHVRFPLPVQIKYVTQKRHVAQKKKKKRKRKNENKSNVKKS